MKRALVLRHHLEDDAGLVGEAFTQRDFVLTTELFDRKHAYFSTDGYDAIIVLGSNSSVYDEDVRRSWFNQELTLMGEAFMSNRPIFGICFGAQALCVLHGGEVERAPEGEHGWVTIDVNEGVALPEGPWFEYHSDRCLLPDDATILATTDRAVQAFTVGRNLAVQFHPEIDDAQLARWFQSGSDEPRAHSEREAALLEETKSETPAARLRVVELVDFFLAHAGI